MPSRPPIGRGWSTTRADRGGDDQIVPIGDSAMLSSKLVKKAVLKIYPGASHALGDTSKEQLNVDPLEFIEG